MTKNSIGGETGCPQCGGRVFTLTVEQQVDVEFNGDDHRVTDGPRGDVGWDDATHAICTGCNYSATLGEMKHALKGEA